MRAVIRGDGADVTKLAVGYLSSGKEYLLANLYLIGEPEDPTALWLTDWESPLLWAYWGGTFLPAVIKRGPIGARVGLEVADLTLTWTPAAAAYGVTMATANPYQLASMGYYDNLKVRVWRALMPAPGDVNSYGVIELFGGRIASTTVERGKIEWKVNSFLDVVNQYVPTNVIELLNTVAAYKGATPPAGMAQIPEFDLILSDNKTVIGDCTSPTAHHLFTTNSLQGGFLVFNSGGTLDGVFSAIFTNYDAIIGADHYNGFILYTPLPWPATVGVDTFFVSARNPINQADGDYYGFPYVPSPTAAISGG